MDTSGLKKFAQEARRTMRELVASKLDLVLSADGAARREFPAAVKQVESEIAKSSRDQVIEKVAYTWFNRFSALRFMDANGYTGTRVLSPADGQTRPEILSEAIAGVIGDEVPEGIAVRVRKLLDGHMPSSDPQGEAYRLLVVAVCNHWHGVMPFMFEKIADYTELLMPDDLLSASSVVAKMREVMTDEACQDVEIIGWLYQFYISEKKDEVFAGLKKNKKITPENIPAATQLFTPHWIVRYLVENSLGRLWLLNRPGSKLSTQMDYYIAPEEPETDFLRILKPEEIKLCDPACGSGHMLTYAFDLLHAIYEEEGYDAAGIPALILTHNLHGIEIDDRSGALAAFALAMKAAARLGRRRFLRLKVQPNICVLHDVRFTAAEMQNVAAVVGRDLFTRDLQLTLGQFEQAKNLGSLIIPKLRAPAEAARLVELKDFSSDLLLREVQERVLAVLRMAEALSVQYDVVVANPPYMGGQGMNDELANFAKHEFPDAKADLFSLFMMRGTRFTRSSGLLSMVTMQSWMFLSAFELMRVRLLENNSIVGFTQIGYNSFPEINSKIALACAFIISIGKSDAGGAFINLNDAPQSADKVEIFMRYKAENKIFWRKSHDFSGVPGSPIAYWLSANFLQCFSKNSRVGDHARAAKGLVTANNEAFVRNWSEISYSNIGFGFSRDAATVSRKRWFPYAKGGNFRRWFGNFDSCVNWENDGHRIQTELTDDGKRVRATNFNLDRIFKAGISWTVVTTSDPTFRVVPAGFLFDAAAGILQSGQSDIVLLGSLNSKISKMALAAINPTLNLHPGYLENVPYAENVDSARVQEIVSKLVTFARTDWDAYETSWDFAALPLLKLAYQGDTLSDSYLVLRQSWQRMTEEMRVLEEENNRVFIDAYGLQDELTPEVPLDEITLTCNPAYRYGGKTADAELETRLRSDTIAEFLSYAVGCMFGRYSLDAPGLVLANQGEGVADYLARVPSPSFAPDTENVIPVLDGDWFADDISERFREFLRVTFGDTRFQENLDFIEEALGKDIRKYFTRDFFNDHVKRYKKRPIYWLFSSPKGTFNALIYMHRYTPDTVSVVLNDYLRVFRSKLEAHKLAQERMSINANATAAQRTAALKGIPTIAQQIVELDDWERDVVYPLATRRIEIDLDDGVKANYPKFAGALKPIKGLEEAQEE